MIIDKIEYKNPWFSPLGGSPKIYKRMNIKADVSLCKRGMILSYLPNQHDYLVNGKVVTQRVGKSMEILERAISYLLDGGVDFMHADRIREAYNNGAK